LFLLYDCSIPTGGIDFALSKQFSLWRLAMNETERQEKLAALAHCKAGAEKSYDDMYEAHSFRDANDCYRDAKDYFYAAIGHANSLEMQEEADALLKRLEHVKSVFRSQFVQ
jgi:hypothetical protein